MNVGYIKKKKQFVIKFTKQELRNQFENTQTLIFTILIIASVLGLFYPTMVSFLLSFSLLSYYILHKEIFGHGLKQDYYKKMLMPKASFAHFVRIGYEVDEEELEKHLILLNQLDNSVTKAQAVKQLASKEKKVKNYAKWKEVGLSKNQLTTHFWVIGTTGAGKTSFIMTLIDMVIKNGAGCIFIDGKADEKMFAKLYNLASQAGRQHDVFLLNFLGIEGEAKEHTNTFNPITGAPPEQIIEFLMALQGEASGDQAYWQGRGKALLSPIVYALSLREKYYGEKFTITMLADFINDANKFLILCGFVRSLCMYYENLLKEDEQMNLIIKKASFAKGLADDNFPTMDAIVYYYTLRPSEKAEILTRGYSYEKLNDIWRTYQQVMNYAKSLHQEVTNTVDRISLIFYKGSLEEGVDLESLSWNEALQLFKNTLHKEAEAYIQQQDGDQRMTMEDLLASVNFPTGQAAGDASQQHAYAQQQWTQIFAVLTTYSYIFDTLEPEVDILDVLKNQKILYVLLPPLKQSASTTQLLGKLIVTAMRFAISKALGGYVENLDSKQKKILEEIITPRPLGLCIFDEYGSYPVEGIDTFLAQVRSINISVVLSTQDYTSARVGGKDENSVKRAWANTQKLILRVKDNETLDAIEKVIKKTSELTESFMEAELGGYMSQSTMSVSDEKKSSFDVSKLPGFKNGLGLLITDDEPIITQIYWADCEPADKVYLNHFVKFN